MLDGGRVQTRAEPSGPGVTNPEWHEPKSGCFLTLDSKPSKIDRQPEPPYVTNNIEKMDYPRYRKLGLPISSAPVESTIKQFNKRVKGSEKFWRSSAAEAVLQIRAAQLSQDDRADRLWAMPRPYRAARHKPIPAVA